MRLKFGKTLIFILIYLSIGIFCSILLFLNFKKQANIVKEISHNMIAIQDFNTLKTAISPLLLSDIKSIKIFHHEHVIFEVGQPAGFGQLNSFNDVVEFGPDASYTVFVQFSMYKYLLIYTLNIGFSYLLYSFYLNFKNKLDFKNYIAHLSQKLAHDIRTPISTLNIISSKITDIEIRQLQLSVVKQINEIANDLLDQSKIGNTFNHNNDHQNNQDVNSVKLTELLLNLEKEYKFKSIALKQKIIFRLNEELLKGCAIDHELIKIIYPILNNLIQNSIDATTENNEIMIYTLLENKKLHLIVKDDGKGMPSSVLEQIGKKPISFGKEEAPSKNHIVSGNGIALYNAKNDLARFNADLYIESKIGVGTKISVTLPFTKV
jgi:signal transduction histidine kinase